MPLKTQLTNPYFSGDDEEKDYYKVLFQPGVSVQVQELNDLQLILQRQIERFGDNIFKQGTIVNGCNFSFFPNYDYIKIDDTDSDGVPAVPSNYQFQLIDNETTGLRAAIVNYKDGFESADPNLKTLYLRYLNSGSNGTTNAFASGDVLKISDFKQSVQKIKVNDGSSGFSNSDTLIVTSAIVVNVASGTFTNGEYLTNGTANVQIIGIDDETLVDSSQIILNIKPKAADLANSLANSTLWTFANNDSVRNVSNTVTGVIEGVIGRGLAGVVKTNGVGKISEIVITTKGQEYSTVPDVSVASSNNSAGIASLNLVAQNYYANVVVASTANAVGHGYAFGVGRGVIYQRGHFLRVAPQTIIIDKYSNTPNALAVGFTTQEVIVDSDIDTTLLDNAFVEENENAPGAARLQMRPVLQVIDSSEIGNTPEFLALVQWSEGNAYRLNENTEYAKINDEMARRTKDEAGDFVIDPFLVTTRSPLDANDEGQYASILIDPGKAYIDGYRVETVRNYSVDIEKGIDTKISNVQSVGLNYGNFVYINNVGGLFQFSTGDTVDLYDTAKRFLSNNSLYSSGNTTPVGTKIGTASIRSLVPEYNIPGKYRLYMFNINMLTGKNFRDTRSIYYNGTNKGIADIVTELDATLNANTCKLQGANNSTLVFYSGVESLKNANNVEYVYRTIDQTASFANSGLLVKDISASVDEFYPYSGSLSSTQLADLVVVPLGASLVYTNNITGTMNVNTTSTTVTGSGTDFVTDLDVGDYIYLSPNATANCIRRVVAIANSTSLTLDANCGFTNGVSNAAITFPQYVPIPFGTRDGLSGNVDSNSNILTLDLGSRFRGTTSVNTAIAVNIKRVNPTQLTKTPNRNKFVKICISNNAGGVNGPWCIGVPDVFRLRNVYMDSNSTINSSSYNVTTNFYIDNNQNPDFYGLSYLYVKPKSGIELTTDKYLLVEFDYFSSTTGGFFDTVSYVSANATQRFLVDSQPLSNLSSTVNSFEIPEFYAANGKNYDLMSYLDFRPKVANTVAPASTEGAAPLNPGSTISFGNTADPTNDKKFPVPDNTLEMTVEQFLGRIDSVFVAKDGNIDVVRGLANTNIKSQKITSVPEGTIKIADMAIPSYPNIPIVRSRYVERILATGVSNENYLKKRLDNKTISRVFRNLENITTLSQPKNYSQADIGNMDRRLRDVEYVVQLSLLESDLKNRVIPSSIDPTLNRFKYGFFVDQFINYLYSERDNPQYSTYIEDSCIVPEKMVWTLNFQPYLGPVPFIDETVISQTNCTVPKNFVEPECLPDTKIANTYAVATQFFDQQVGNTTSEWIDTRSYTFAAANNGQSSLYYYNYDTFTKIEVYQGNTLIISTKNGTNLTAAEKTFVVSNTTFNWFNDQTTTFMQNTVISGDYAKYAGKITWTHNISNGRNYTVKVYKGSGAYRWRYILEYPIDRATVGCPTPPPAPTWDYYYYYYGDGSGGGGDGGGADGGGGGCDGGGDGGGDGGD